MFLIRHQLSRQFILLFIVLCTAGKSFAQIDTTKMAWPPGMTQKQKIAYMKYFGNFHHPEVYYKMPVDKQRQFDVSMHKNKSLRSKGWLMAGVGAAFVGIGAAIPSESDNYTNAVFYGLGGALILGSVPLFVTSAKRGKEARLIIKNASGKTSAKLLNPQLGLRLQF